MTRTALSLMAAATLALLCFSCSSQKPKNEPAAAPTHIQGVKHTNQHWVQGEQLQALMKTISAQAQNLPKPPSQDTESKPIGPATFTQAAALADSLSSAAQRIPLAIEGVDLGEADRRAFAVYAQTLSDQAGQLKKWANARDLEEMQRTFKSINNTCASCHIRYRDLSGNLWPPRANLRANSPSPLAYVSPSSIQ
jgi:cytochrome c556